MTPQPSFALPAATRTLAALAAAVVLGACTEPDDLKLTVDVDKAAFAIDDSTQVSLRLTNVSSLPKQVLPAEAYGLCNHAFSVEDALGNQVQVATAFCLAASSIWIPNPITLAPGQSIEITDRWVPSTSRRNNGEPLVPGSYFLQGRAWGDERTLVSGKLPILLLSGSQ